MHPGYIKPRTRCEDSAQEYDTEQKKIILGECEFKSFCYALHFRYGGKKSACVYCCTSTQITVLPLFPTDFRSPTFFPKSKIKPRVGLK